MSPSKLVEQCREEMKRERHAEAKALAEEYKIEDVDALKKLIADLRIMSAYYPSETPLFNAKDEIVRHIGDEAWSDAKDLLKKAAKSADKLTELLYKISENRLAMAVIGEVDSYQSFANNSSGMHELTSVLWSASAKKGKDGGAFRQEWTYAATELCFDFWKKHMGKPKVYFANKNPSKPSNEFTKWFLEMMKLVANVTNTQSKTFLEDRRPD